MKVLVTAGPTREPIDPVRFITNRSSGKMGYAVARAAIERGHEVILVSGPVSIPAPDGAVLVSVVTASEMLAAVRSHFQWCDTLVMAAAVCDWRPKSTSAQKLKKESELPTLAMERTVDILRSLAPEKGSRIVVGFAAETSNIIDEARRKLHEKNLDLVVANDVSRADSGFEVDTNRITLVTRDGHARELPLMSKDGAAARIIEWVETKRKAV